MEPANLRGFVAAIAVAVGILGALSSVRTALAAVGDCGQPVSAGASPTASDSLFILKVAVGTGQCDPCVCDIDGNTAIQATDALLSLKTAVGQAVTMLCPACSPSTTRGVVTTSTTTMPVVTTSTLAGVSTTMPMVTTSTLAGTSTTMPVVTTSTLTGASTTTMTGMTTSTLAATTTTLPSPGCGDGILTDGEQCDDGNVVSGDGCSAACALEDARGLCAGVPSVAGTAIRAELLVSGLTRPVGIEAAPLDTERIFVVEQRGAIRIVENGMLSPSPFLDIDSLVDSASGSERGLLGLAFDPDYATSRRFFVNYTDNNGDTVIARYEALAGDPDHADPASAKVLLSVMQPFSNHNGGQLAFGPDGFLYASLGDGGSANDPAERAQDDTTLLGKLLRIDVDVEQAPYYAVPALNPHADRGMPLGLIWAKGLRNPWRFSFDRGTGDVYIGDVGQGAFEEIDFQPAGTGVELNYGWDHFEGNHCLPSPDVQPPCPATSDGFTMPIHEYGHAQGCSVTGGYVYRGCALPDLRGIYFYGDYCNAFIHTLRVENGSAVEHTDRTAELDPPSAVTIEDISSFGEDARGELYIADLNGEIFKIVPAGD